MNKNHHRAAVIMRVCILGSFLFLNAYIFVYLFQPFPAQWRDLFNNLSVILTVVLATVLTTLIAHRYSRSDPSHLLWMAFASGLWAWSIADVAWGGYVIFQGNVPQVSLADLFYVIGYVFLAVALNRQFSILKHPTKPTQVRRISLITASFLLAILFVTFAIADFVPADMKLNSFLNVFYPFADAGLGLYAIIFVINFRGGLLARPWIGLSLFAIADGIYAWSFENESYAYSVINVNFTSLLADTLYLATYLVLVLFLLNHLLLLIYGPSIKGGFDVRNGSTIHEA